jgi:hypothetical protein
MIAFVPQAIGPIRAEGSRTMTRSTIAGVPLPSRKDTKALRPCPIA